MPLVSVVIPVHNAGRYLDSCLESVRRQTHHDLQIVCIDDGSNDQSTAVLGQHSDADARLHAISQVHSGPGSARNAGLAHAVGDYIMFVDADDLVPSDAVERHLNALRSSSSDFSTGRVMRIVGTYRWPSAMHENGLTRPALASHIFQDTGLLFDTTSWNKLFRRDYWTAHRYTFPEHVAFEDVPLMTEAHCRASSVCVLGDVVYWWRRRDDGIMSITMRRDDPDLLRDRVASLQNVRRLLGDVAPARVRRAAETKFLRHDLGSYFRELENTPPAFQREFVRIVREFIGDSPDTVVDRLPHYFRVAYQLIRLGKSSELVEFLAFLRENEWRVPIQRRGVSLRVDLGPVAQTVPRKLSSAARRLPLRTGVDRLSWNGESLVIEGFGFIDGVAFAHPAAALRRLQLVNPHMGEVRYAWIAPRRLPPIGPRVRMTPSYEWSGFRAELPVALLDPGPAHDSARWQVNLQVLALGAAGGSALGPPAPGSAFNEIKFHPSGVVVRIDWAAGKRLIIEAARVVYVLCDVAHVDGLISLSLRTSASLRFRPQAMRLIPTAGGPAVEVPVSSMEWAPAGELVRVLIDPVPLLTGWRAGHPLTFSLAIVTSAGGAHLTLELQREFTLSTEDGDVIVADDGRGGVQVVVAGRRLVVNSLSWVGDQLQLTGVCSWADHALPRLAWCNGVGDMIHSSSRRTSCGFEATFDLMSVPGPDGVHPLPAGEWTLMQQLADRSWAPASASHVGTLASERSRVAGLESIRIGLNSRLQLAMFVDALPAPERSAIGQQRLEGGAYRRALRSPIANVILLESWGGKNYSDNPRALAEAASCAAGDATVVVVVADRSVPTPPKVRVVLSGSRAHHEQRARASLIISNDCLPKHYVKRSGQRYLQTWHGTPLKRIGLDIERIRFRNDNYASTLR